MAPVAGDSKDWEDNGDGTYTAERGDSASSLYNQHLKTKGYTEEEVNNIVEFQHGNNRKDGDKEYSNIVPGDVVELKDSSKSLVESEEAFGIIMTYADKVEETAINNEKLDSIGDKINVRQSVIDGFTESHSEVVSEGPHGKSFALGMSYQKSKLVEQNKKSWQVIDSIKKVNKDNQKVIDSLSKIIRFYE